MLQGAAWQRCRVHFMRNILTALPKGRQEMVASIIRTIFAQPDAEHIDAQFDEVARMIERVHPKAADMLHEARADILAFRAFPARHWRQIWSTNPLELLNREIKRRTDVVGIFPNIAALLRLAGSILVEQHDEWEAGDRRYFTEASMAELTATINPVDEGVDPHRDHRRLNCNQLNIATKRKTPLKGTRPRAVHECRMTWSTPDLPASVPTVARIPLPPFADVATHRRYVRLLQLHLALLDPGNPTLTTIALNGALEARRRPPSEEELWLSPLELSASLTSWFPAPWTPDALAATLAQVFDGAEARWYPSRVGSAWRWSDDPDFWAEPDGEGWNVVRHERGSRETTRLANDRELVVMWLDHLRARFPFPLGHGVDEADLRALAPASAAVSAADERDARYPYRTNWLDARAAALDAITRER